MSWPLSKMALGLALLGCTGCVVVPGEETPARQQVAAAPPRQYCREFQQTVTISGQLQQVHGMSCRQPDGTWRLADESVPATSYLPPPPYSPSYYGAPYLMVPVGPPNTGSEERK